MNLHNFRFLILMSAVVLAISCNDQPIKSETVVTKNQPSKVLRHVVVFKFNEQAAEDEVTRINEAFADLQNKIPEIKEFEWGLNNSPEGLDQDFTHCYMLTFHSEEDRDKYLPHPDHKAFGKLLGPYLEKVFVVDYWTE